MERGDRADPQEMELPRTGRLEKDQMLLDAQPSLPARDASVTLNPHKGPVKSVLFLSPFHPGEIQLIAWLVNSRSRTRCRVGLFLLLQPGPGTRSTCPGQPGSPAEKA